MGLVGLGPLGGPMNEARPILLTWIGKYSSSGYAAAVAKVSERVTVRPPSQLAKSSMKLRILKFRLILIPYIYLRRWR